jgi:hypothetical protein
MQSYSQLCKIILQGCPSVTNLVRFSFPLDTTRILEDLKFEWAASGLKTEVPGPGHWFDIRVENIPVQLRVAVVGRDNIFNAPAIYNTLTGKAPTPPLTSLDSLIRGVSDTEWRIKRDLGDEFHYLTFKRSTGEVIFRPLLDLQYVYPHPYNTLQVDWGAEFGRVDSHSPSTRESGARILETCRLSIRLMGNSKVYEIGTV